MKTILISGRQVTANHCFQRTGFGCCVTSITFSSTLYVFSFRLKESFLKVDFHLLGKSNSRFSSLKRKFEKFPLLFVLHSISKDFNDLLHSYLSFSTFNMFKWQGSNLFFPEKGLIEDINV